MIRYPLGEMVVSYAANVEHVEGMSVSELADRRGVSVEDAVCDLLVETDLALGHVMAPPSSVAVWRQISRDSMELLARPDYMVCSDITPAGSFPHPRSYGAFPRFLGRLRRQIGGISLEAMVHRMTDRPARRFGLTRRGRIDRGYFADLTVFAPERVIDTATYDDPRQYPVGIPLRAGQRADRGRRRTMHRGHGRPRRTVTPLPTRVPGATAASSVISSSSMASLPLGTWWKPTNEKP